MADRLRFYLDEHIPPAVAKGLDRYDIDAITVFDVDLDGAPDAEQLAFADHNRRVLVTRDNDFARLHALGSTHHGIIFFPRDYSIGEMVRQLHLAFEVLMPVDLEGRIEYL